MPLEKEQIPLLPSLPPEVRDAAEINNLVVFIGAGVSRLAGCPSWDELAHDLLQDCLRHKFITCAEHDAISRIGDRNKIITICDSIYKECGVKDGLVPAVRGLLDVQEPDANSNPYNQIKRLRAIYITTNADLLVDKFLDCSSTIYDPWSLDHITPATNYLYHIHGSIKQGFEDTLVFTVPKYLALYNKPEFKRFLSRLFDFVVLFIGYGVEEFEMMDYLIPKSESSDAESKDPMDSTTIEATTKKRFTLQPYFEWEADTKLKYDRLYFEHLNIKVVPYLITQT